MTTHGRVFLISDPTVGSRLADQISPRRGGIFPGFRHGIGKSIDFQLDFSHLGILICDLTGANEPLLAFGQLVGQGIGHVARAVTGRNPLRKNRSQIPRQRKCHLTASHTAILPYLWLAGWNAYSLSLPPTFNTARNASCGISTRPTRFMRFLPSFCFSSSLRLREMSPP